MREIKRSNGKIVGVLMVCLIFSFVVGAEPLTEEITCNGCVGGLLSESYDNFMGYVTQYATIILTGPDGYQSYIWLQDGERVGSEQGITMQITDNTIFTLLIGDDNEDSEKKVKTVEIQIASSEETCEIGTAEIRTDSVTLAVGQEVSIWVEFDESECPNARYSWSSNDKNVVFENSNTRETKVLIKGIPDGGKNPVITVKITHKKQVVEETIRLQITDNFPPTIAGKYSYTTPLSHTEFTVDCNNCATGNDVNESGDSILSLNVVVINNKDGDVVASGYDSVNKDDDRKPEVTMTLGDECNCTIEVTATDSFGASTTVTDILLVGFGNTGDEVPVVKIKEPVLCDGLACVFDTRLTNDNNLSFFITYTYRTVSGWQELRDKDGNLCRSPVCNGVFPEAGYVYETKITMKYIRDGVVSDAFGEKIVYVDLRNIQQASISTPLIEETTSSIAAVQVTEISNQKSGMISSSASQEISEEPHQIPGSIVPADVPAKPSPLDIIAVFAAMVAAAIFKKRNKSNN